MKPGHIRKVAQAAVLAAGPAIAWGGLSPPPMAAPPLDGPSANVNPRYAVFKARTIVWRAQRGDVPIIQPTDVGGGLMIVDTDVKGDVLILPSTDVIKEKKP